MTFAPEVDPNQEIGWILCVILSGSQLGNRVDPLVGNWVAPISGNFAPKRVFGNFATVICGEVSAVRCDRKQKKVVDEYKVSEFFDRQKIRYILNPFHTWARRYEINEKRKYYSRHNKVVLSVWCRSENGKGEAKNPWIAFHDGVNITDCIKEIRKPIPQRPDIRIGVIEI